MDLSRSHSTRFDPVLSRMIRVLWFPAYVCLILVLMLRIQWIVVSALAPFALLTLLVAIAGGRRLVFEKWTLSLLVVSLGQLFYPIAALALILWKLDVALFGLPIGIIMLTSLHFHFAGLGLPVLLSQLENAFPIQKLRVLPLLIVLTIPLVGIGIACSPLLEVCAAMLLSLQLMIVAIWQLEAGMKFLKTNKTAAILLMISAISLLGSMPLAMVYASGEFLQIQQLQIPTMIIWHGSLNACGYCLCGLVGFNLLQSATSTNKKTSHSS
ncbi:MAG: YndJ family transporter [Planctomycetaceae bacterium]